MDQIIWLVGVVGQTAGALADTADARTVEAFPSHRQVTDTTEEST